MIYRGTLKLSTKQRAYLELCDQKAALYLRREARRNKLLELGAPAVIIAHENRMVKEAQDDLDRHPLARKLLFQQQSRLDQVLMRSHAIAQTQLGQLDAALLDPKLSFPIGEGFMPFSVAVELLKGRLDQELFDIISSIVHLCVHELLHTQLPAVGEDLVIEDDDLPREWFE